MKNPYFKNDPAERQLMEDLLMEAIGIHGLDVVYIPREKVVRDNLFGEDWLSKFGGGAGFVEMYVQSFDGFEGGAVFSKFGIEHKEKMTFIVSKRHFEKAMAHVSPEMLRPREGDIIHILPLKQFFEITFVDNNVPIFYQGERLYHYKITAEGYSYEGDDINSQFTEIDNLAVQDKQILVELNLNANGICGAFQNNETVYVGSSVTGSSFYGTLVNYDKNNPDVLQIKDSGGSAGAAIGQIIKGSISGASGPVVSDSNNTKVNVPLDGFADNDTIRAEGHTIIDFSEIDPFSEGNY